MKNTTQVMVIMIQEERGYSTEELLSGTNLTLVQLKTVLAFLQKGTIINPTRYVKTKTKPYRKAYYSLNPEKYEAVINLVERDYK